MHGPDVIIWSADVPDEAAMFERLKLMPDLAWIKVDRLFLENNPDKRVIERLQTLGLLVFDDAKIDEIPDKSVGIAGAHLKYRPAMLNCMAEIISTGYATHEDPKKVDGLKRFADACHAAGTRPCAVTVKTSKTAEIVAAEHNGRTSIEQVLFYAERLVEFGFTDMVCSPQEAGAIRAERLFDVLTLNNPGIVLPGGDQRDQARVDTPANALANGGNIRLVIGTALTKGDAAANFAKIMANIQAGVAA